MHQKLENWVTDEGLTKIYDYCANGCTMVNLAKLIGISIATLYEWMDRDENFYNAVKTGKSRSTDMVEDALFNTAINGNVTAQIFWLKNRRKERWSDKVQQDINTQHTETIVLEVQ